eukprot:XP_011677365.1 PREDICTED: fibronectin-like [Strongylocentrotus purpuratus]
MRYSLYQKLACSSPETTPTEFELNTNVTQYNLVGLEPYSRYQITVTAVNGAGQSEPTIGYSDTRPGPPSNITNVRVNPERTSPTRLGFTWQPLNCRNANGVIWYYYPRIYKDGDRSRTPAGSTYLDEDLSYSSVEFNGLEACTMYGLIINARNQPSNITNVRVNPERTSPTRLGFTWQPLNCRNVNGVIWYYYLRIFKDCDRVGLPAGRTYLDNDFSYSSVEFNGLKACTMYELHINAVNRDVIYVENLFRAIGVTGVTSVVRGEESLPINVIGDTRGGEPSAIESVSYTSTAHSLHFVWEEPSCENLQGVLDGYDVDLYDPTEPPSFLEANIIVLDVTSHSITIRWAPWNETYDRGDGPVIGYRVYYNTHEQDDIAKAPGHLIIDPTFTINNLTRDTEYDFRVTASREGPVGEGMLSSVAGARTKCTAPSEPPVLSVRNRGRTFITLHWEVIPEESWGCSALSGLEINVSTDGQNGLPRTLSFDTTAGTANIGQLEECTTYGINAAFRNKDGLGISSEILSASTSMIPPASVEALHTSPSTTQIEVSWELSSSLCSADYYIMRYSLYQKLACSSPETTPTEFELNTNVTQYNLVGLEPYSRYQITVTAVNGAGQSEPTIGYSDTRPGPPSNITNVRVNPERTSPTRLGFTWQPLNCRNANGVIWYYYPRIYKDGDRSRTPAGSTYLDEDLSYSSVEFNGLEACTMYGLIINARNRDVPYSGNNSYAIGVTGVTFYELNVTSVSTDIPRNLSNFGYYTTYNISIIAVVRGEESLPINVIGDTRDGEPSAIESVSYTSTARSLHFVWEEPSCENLQGVLDGYDVDLYDPTEPPSFLEANIIVLDMTSHSITIRWTPWNETYDHGDGPVIGYRVYYNTHGQDDIVKAPGHLIKDTTSTINNLTRDTEYDFRVTASREGPVGEGMLSSVARTRTKCSAPASVEALQMSPSTTQIEVSWALSSSLCSADYYIIRYSLYQKLACSSPETTPTEFELNTNVTQYNYLVGLEPYSQYQITVTAVNGAGQSEPTIGYSDTRPGPNEPIGRARCIGDSINQSQWQHVDNCGPFRNVTDTLTKIAQVIVSEENAGEVSQQVLSVTSNIEDITSDDITFVAEITSQIVQQNLTSEEVTESITSIASNIAQVETEELVAAEEDGGAITKFVQAFEEQISRVEVADGEMLNIQKPNVAVQVQSVPAEDIMRGIVLSLAGSSLSDLTKSNITINAPTQDDRNDIIAQVNIPSSLSGSPSNGSGEYVRVSFYVFSTPALFISKSLRTISADNERFNRSANSPLISLSIGQGKVAALTEFINFTFTTLKSGYVNPICSFWDEEKEDWSQDGCVLVSGFGSSDDRYDEEGVRCACDHLTNFAVIMDIHRQKDSLIEAYNILTYIGCCISIFSLLVTLATYLWNK